ncbi:hypothetical protein [Ruegeria lacuscaerulensis]|uniref:hypothetical protein n=1 Tax=Ruegeria lacuscaerulensis TaxID=55218 RepID=UPI00147C008B|nr:hypothetical protein [Ruegeria lacuscaerulensis]
MTRNTRVFSHCGSRIFEISGDEQGGYRLQEFARKYDAEEEVTYEIKVMSNLGGLFGDFDTALKEAERLAQQ